MRKLIVLLVLIVACSRSESALPVASRVPSAAEPVAAAPPSSRMIVRTANIKIIVDDTSKAVDAVTKSVEAMGGYVAGSQVWREGELLRARLTLRLPNEKLTPALASIRGVARRVDNETMSSEDVTQEFVDLQSQVRNLEATEVELRELLTAVRKNARKAGEVLEVHKQLTAIRGEIEQAKGRMRYLDHVTALSSIALDIAPDAVLQPVVEAGWQPLVVIRDASRALVGVLRSIATVAIWIVIYVVPLAGMLALVVAVVGKVYRRMRERASHVL